MVGQFKDDCIQYHEHDLFINDTRVNQSGVVGSDYYVTSIAHAQSKDWGRIAAKEIVAGRVDTVTHGKQKGVKFIIKVL